MNALSEFIFSLIFILVGVGIISSEAKALVWFQPQDSAEKFISAIAKERENIFDTYQTDKVDYLNLKIPEINPGVSIEYDGNAVKHDEVTVKVVVAKKAPVSKVASIGLPGPILSDVRIINGRNVCEHENDKPKKSKKTSKRHIDGECCLDPDEIPNSNCFYSQEKYGKLIQKYLNPKK